MESRVAVRLQKANTPLETPVDSGVRGTIGDLSISRPRDARICIALRLLHMTSFLKFLSQKRITMLQRAQLMIHCNLKNSMVFSRFEN